MFGKFVLRLQSKIARRIPLRTCGLRTMFAGFIFLSTTAIAQTQKATVTNSNAAIYRSPDFSSPVLGRVKAGTQWVISTKPFGLFYQIQIKPGLTGYIAENDLSILGRASKPKPAEAIAAKKTEDKVDKSYLQKRRPFKNTNFWGITFGSLRYREETIGMRPSDQLTMLGLTLSGPEIVITGYPTEFNLLFSTGAPKYYADATGDSADGFLLMANFLLMYNYPSTQNLMTFFGFGPMYKYSRFGVIGYAPNGAGTVLRTNQSLEDMAIGVLFNAGVSARMSNFALRLEATYYWEKLQYYGVQLSSQFAF